MNETTSTYCQTRFLVSSAGNVHRFTFTGKGPRKGWRTPLNTIICSEQRDTETGYSCFGARYLDHELTTMWLSVDPVIDNYPSLSPYNYCAWNRPTGGHEHRLIKSNLVNNPVKLVDPDGQDARITVFEKDGKKQLCIQTTVYLQSSEFKKSDLARLARNYTDAAKRKLKSMDVDGVSISFDVSFKVFEDNTILLPGDNVLKLNPNNKDDRSGVPCKITRKNGVLIEETCSDDNRPALLIPTK